MHIIPAKLHEMRNSHKNVALQVGIDNFLIFILVSPPEIANGT